MNYLNYLCLVGVNATRCIESEVLCNCDAKLPYWQVDEGLITDKGLLPITEFAYGPLQYDLEEAKVTIGNLKCSGTTSSAGCGNGAESAAALVKPPKIQRDDCDMITMESDTRLRIDIPYRNSQNCWMILDFPAYPVSVNIAFDNFRVSKIFRE